MHLRARPVRQLFAFAFGWAALAAVAQGDADYRNVTAGGSLRPGIYGRIVLRGNAAPPPVIYPEPVLANGSIERVQREPVYLYVPPGQVRKWKQNCAKWAACDEPVLFVRMDGSPSRWGAWRQRRDQLAGDPHHHPH
ncbi:hypothetical protein [Ramlibacter alkalitolerans]|uniref:Lipoprotein n=1 Tax=Ramlibacter alkalitolerans TaxID=2039631 RepID=A0ABS1JJ85_9BURK|nr:hypothetical protein [Ramlibacter alkalitolerans]MBL0424287.1 hypothetical protein [Ramlibacter alkalitolerans]